MTRYATAAAFEQAVENRLRSTSAGGVDFARKRQLIIFDRFLARIVRALGDARCSKADSLWSSGRARPHHEAYRPPARLSTHRDSRTATARAGLDLREFMVFTVVPDAQRPETRTRYSAALAGL